MESFKTLAQLLIDIILVATGEIVETIDIPSDTPVNEIQAIVNDHLLDNGGYNLDEFSWRLHCEHLVVVEWDDHFFTDDVAGPGDDLSALASKLADDLVDEYQSITGDNRENFTITVERIVE